MNPPMSDEVRFHSIKSAFAEDGFSVRDYDTGTEDFFVPCEDDGPERESLRIRLSQHANPDGYYVEDSREVKS